jgi:hypothetical protein
MEDAGERFDTWMVAERLSVESALLELDHRSSGHVDISLWWSSRTGAVVLEVVDWQGDADFAVAVEPARAHDAFNHPFSYAPRPEP